MLPEIHPVIDLKNWTGDATAKKIFFDPEGMPLKELLATLNPEETLVGCTGPAGDLTHEEKSWLREQGFEFCALTPTVLRAEQALTVGLGVLRSYV